MDLLGDLGAADQLTSARTENAVLQEKVKHLNFRVKELSIENESLKAEVELYRNEAALPNFSNMALGVPSKDDSMMDTDDNAAVACDDFLRSGNGVYAGNQAPEICLSKLHENANILCCALSHDDTILATGGADCHVTLAAWGAADTNGRGDASNAAALVVQGALRVPCNGPVIAVAFHPKQKIVAAGCMDGNVWVFSYDMITGAGLTVNAQGKIPNKHAKYVKTVAWSSGSTSSSLLATASADGTVQVHQVGVNVDYVKDETQMEVTTIETLHLSGAVESLCFVKDELCCYARGKPYLMCFDTTAQNKQRKINLNSGGKPAAAGTSMEDQHVSFAVMDMAPSPNDNGKYLALATDASRNIIVDFSTGIQVRNLYGHKNDGFSNPKLAWSCNGQYLLGNTQEDASVCVWDIASSQIVARKTEHGQTVRGMFASSTTDTLVTTSFDKQTKIWFASSS